MKPRRKWIGDNLTPDIVSIEAIELNIIFFLLIESSFKLCLLHDDVKL